MWNDVLAGPSRRRWPVALALAAVVAIGGPLMAGFRPRRRGSLAARPHARSGRRRRLGLGGPLGCRFGGARTCQLCALAPAARGQGSAALRGLCRLSARELATGRASARCRRAPRTRWMSSSRSRSGSRSSPGANHARGRGGSSTPRRCSPRVGAAKPPHCCARPGSRTISRRTRRLPFSTATGQP